MIVYVDRTLLKSQFAKIEAKCDECLRPAEEAVVRIGLAGQVCLMCLKRAVASAEAAVAKDMVAKPLAAGVGLTEEEIAWAWPRASAKFDFKMNGCWLWKGETINRGYGAFPYRSSTGRTKHVVAHRFIYQCLVGPIANGLTLDHLCRERLCVNPSHLDPCSRQENIRRRPSTGSKKQPKPTHCPNGHEYPLFKGAYKCLDCRAVEKRRRKLEGK